MSPVAQAVLASWSFPAVATALNLLAALPYIRGWITLRVQDADSGSPRLDLAVDIAAQPPTGRPNVLHASHVASANKLLAAATAELPRSGAWNVLVSVRRGVQEAAVSTKLQVLPSKSAPGTVAADSAR